MPGIRSGRFPDPPSPTSGHVKIVSGRASAIAPLVSIRTCRIGLTVFSRHPKTWKRGLAYLLWMQKNSHGIGSTVHEQRNLSDGSGFRDEPVTICTIRAFFFIINLNGKRIAFFLYTYR
jgi:hypothetical protein